MTRRHDLKARFDALAGIALAAFLLPALAAIAIAIRVEGWVTGDRGPVLAVEPRVSRGRPFRLLKFRTLRAGVLARAAGRSVKTFESPENRTRVGRFLADCYLDELPQILHVATGRMSLVGPRPFHPSDYEDELARGHELRRVLPAGLTGPFQVEKGTPGFRDRSLSLDRDYLEVYRSSSEGRLLAYDLRILARTFRTVVRGGGW